MNYSESNSFFYISNYVQLDNTFCSRLFCLKDFFKKGLIFPFALILKACKTVLRAIGACFGVLLLVITLGNSVRARTFFSNRILSLVRDLADWIFLPCALIGRLFRLILALLIHPNLYFS